MKKLLLLFTTALILLLALNGCSKQPLTQQVLQELIKPEYTGRLIGTAGNENAAKYLSDMFKEIEVSPYSNDSYLMAYQQLTGDPNEQNTTITVIYKDGSSAQLIHGKDFITNAVAKDLNIDLPIEFDPTKATSQVIPVIKDTNLSFLNSLDAEVLILAREKMRLVVGTPETDSIFNIAIPEELLDKLVKDKAVRMQITAKYAGKDSTLHNVVGVIKGATTSAKKALVLTAHFDHVGMQGDYLFNGALDNASGTAALVCTAQKIKDLVKDKALDFDIIIAAVNSEESNADAGICEGSKVLAKELATQYNSMVNINIDCVGSKKFPLLAMGAYGRAGDDLILNFQKELDKSNIAFNEDPYAGSDHLSFLDAGYPAFSIGNATTEALGGMHISTLTAEDIDITFIEKLCDTIASYAVSGKAFAPEKIKAEPSMRLDFNDKAVVALAKTALEKVLKGRELAFNEHIYFEMQGTAIKATVNKPFINNEEIHKFFPDISFPTQIGKYNFSNVRILSLDNLEFEKSLLPDKCELGEIYTHSLIKDNITALVATYDSEKKLTLTVIVDFNTSNVREGYNSLLLDDLGYENFELLSRSGNTGYGWVRIKNEDYQLTAHITGENYLTIYGTKEEMIDSLVKPLSEQAS